MRSSAGHVCESWNPPRLFHSLPSGFPLRAEVVQKLIKMNERRLPFNLCHVSVCSRIMGVELMDVSRVKMNST